MNQLRLAAATALTLGLALPVSLAYGGDKSHQGAVGNDRIAQSQSAQPASPSAKDDATNETQQAPSGKERPDQAKGMKHPPTAIMDSATPPDKSKGEKAPSVKHPPTSAMDSAAPEQKSPTSSAGKSEESSSDASTAGNRQESKK